MGAARNCFLIFTVILAYLGYKINNFFQPLPVPKLEENWWGSGDPKRSDESIRKFTINISQQEIQDLKYRLEHAKPFTPPLEGIQQQYGMNTKLLQEIVDHWRTKYDWNKRQNYLNQYPQYVTNIQGLDIHFIHVKPKTSNVKVLPLLLLHGWPGSIREFYEIIPMLTTKKDNKDFVFEVIVASLPGFGFSQAAVRPGLGAAQAAIIFKNLMKRIGFEIFYVQGGDFGAIILQHMSVLFPDSVLGFHSNMCTIFTPLSYLKTLIGVLFPTLFTRKEHVSRVYPLTDAFLNRMRETGYFHIQATKPDTIGVALKDSPAGLAAYILEKFTTGTNASLQNRQDGGLKQYYSYDDLLDNVMIYWVTGSMPTAIRLYAETFNLKHQSLGVGRMPVQAPSACARFRNDFYASDGLLKEIYPLLLQLTDHEGGHFAAFQVPKTLANDVFDAVEKFENYHANKNKK